MRTNEQDLEMYRKQLSVEHDRLDFLEKELRNAESDEDKAEFTADILHLQGQMEDTHVEIALCQREMDCEGILD